MRKNTALTDDGYTFSNTWELAFYRYWKKVEGAVVIPRPFTFKYELNGEEHEYLPSFYLKKPDGTDGLYAIKGDQYSLEMRDGKETIVSLYTHDNDDVMLAEYQCAINNGVIFLKKEDISYALEDATLRYEHKACPVRDRGLRDLIIYNGEAFTSRELLDFYKLWQETAGTTIIYEPCSFEYQEGGEIKYYTPDFYVKQADGTETLYCLKHSMTKAEYECAQAHGVDMIYAGEFAASL